MRSKAIHKKTLELPGHFLFSGINSSVYHPNYNMVKHNRKSIRLPHFDYSSEGLYFITLCTQNRHPLFGSIEDGKMKLNKYGEIAAEEWNNTPKIRKNISLDEFIIMPNHIHGIININYKTGSNKDRTGKFISPSNTIGAIIRGYKGATTKKINSLIRESRNPGKSQSSSPHIKSNPPRTGESPFARKEKFDIERKSGFFFMGEWQFAPTDFAPTDSSPTDIGQTNSSPTEKSFQSILPGTGSIWQRNYYEHIIRTQTAYNNISNYIRNNPLNWGKDKFKNN